MWRSGCGRSFWAGPLTDDFRQWLSELLSPEEQELLASQPLRRSDASATRALHEREQRFEQILERLHTPRSALELIRHHRALVLLGDPGSGKTTVLRHLAMSFALARLRADAQAETALDANLAWSGPLPLPILIQLRRFAAELAAAPNDAGPLLAHVEQTLTGDRA